jgi:helix-turn-helix protein
MIITLDRSGEGDEIVDKGKRITGAARETLAGDLKKEYEGGASIRVIADAHGRSYGFVHQVLREAGVTLRGRGGATRSKPGA